MNRSQKYLFIFSQRYYHTMDFSALYKVLTENSDTSVSRKNFLVRAKVLMNIEQILQAATQSGASDILLKVGSKPRMRLNGLLHTLSQFPEISNEIMLQWGQQLLPQRLYKALEANGEVDFAYTTSFNVRFRVNLFKQKGMFGFILRTIRNDILTMSQLNLPPAIEKVTDMKRGLVLVTGATGSGKTTTLGSIIQEFNMTKPCHIITIEDPIEFYYQDDKATINQREVGEDTANFSGALRASLRQDPDIILVGELRDQETTETALMAAETGHLVLSTLHTKDAVDSLTRLMSFFSPHQHHNIRLQLASSLQMVISQRLVPRRDEGGRCAAIEILVANSYIREIIQSGESFSGINEAIKKGNKNYGMQTFDQSLYQLYKEGTISRDQAINQATSRENMKLLMSGIEV